jgi:hypothetical protein
MDMQPTHCDDVNILFNINVIPNADLGRIPWVQHDCLNANAISDNHSIPDVDKLWTTNQRRRIYCGPLAE